MKAVPLFLVLALTSSTPAADDRPNPDGRGIEAKTIERDPKLEAAAATRRRKIAAALHPDAGKKLAGASTAIARALVRESKSREPREIVLAEVKRRFPNALGAQVDVLSFYIVSDFVRRASDEKELAKMVEELKDAGASEEAVRAKVRQTMDKTSKVMQLLSELAKKAAEVQESMIRNIK